MAQAWIGIAVGVAVFVICLVALVIVLIGWWRRSALQKQQQSQQPTSDISHGNHYKIRHSNRSSRYRRKNEQKDRRLWLLFLNNFSNKNAAAAAVENDEENAMSADDGFDGCSYSAGSLEQSSYSTVDYDYPKWPKEGKGGCGKHHHNYNYHSFDGSPQKPTNDRKHTESVEESCDGFHLLHTMNHADQSGGVSSTGRGGGGSIVSSTGGTNGDNNTREGTVDGEEDETKARNARMVSSMGFESISSSSSPPSSVPRPAPPPSAGATITAAFALKPARSPPRYFGSSSKRLRSMISGLTTHSFMTASFGESNSRTLVDAAAAPHDNKRQSTGESDYHEKATNNKSRAHSKRINQQQFQRQQQEQMENFVEESVDIDEDVNTNEKDEDISDCEKEEQGEMLLLKQFVTFSVQIPARQKLGLVIQCDAGNVLRNNQVTNHNIQNESSPRNSSKCQAGSYGDDGRRRSRRRRQNQESSSSGAKSSRIGFSFSSKFFSKSRGQCYSRKSTGTPQTDSVESSCSTDARHNDKPQINPKNKINNAQDTYIIPGRLPMEDTSPSISACRQLLSPQYPVVHALTHSSILRRQGLQDGDYIIRINERTAKGMTALEVSKYIEQYRQQLASSLFDNDDVSCNRHSCNQHRQQHYRTDSGDTGTTAMTFATSSSNGSNYGGHDFPNQIITQMSLSPTTTPDTEIATNEGVTMSPSRVDDCCCTLTILRPQTRSYIDENSNKIQRDVSAAANDPALADIDCEPDPNGDPPGVAHHRNDTVVSHGEYSLKQPVLNKGLELDEQLDTIVSVESIDIEDKTESASIESNKIPNSTNVEKRTSTPPDEITNNVDKVDEISTSKVNATMATPCKTRLTDDAYDAATWEDIDIKSQEMLEKPEIKNHVPPVGGTTGIWTTCQELSTSNTVLIASTEIDHIDQCNEKYQDMKTQSENMQHESDMKDHSSSNEEGHLWTTNHVPQNQNTSYTENSVHDDKCDEVRNVMGTKSHEVQESPNMIDGSPPMYETSALA